MASAITSASRVVSASSARARASRSGSDVGAGGHPGGRQPGRIDLDAEASLEQLVDVVEGQGRDAGTASQRGLDEAVGLQLRESLAQRHPGDTELLGQLALAQPGAGGQLAGDDLRPDAAVEPLGQRFVEVVSVR